MLRISIIAWMLFSASLACTQDQPKFTVFGTIVNGDTIPVVQLREVYVISWTGLTHAEERKLTRLMKNVKIVYPYARLAGIKMLEYEDTLALAPDDKARRKIMKRVEDQLDAQYGKELRDLTVTQGKILLKLVDRETGESTYDLVADFRGEFRAVFYQAFARLFGMNMKLRYDPEGEDREIEQIVRLIENGQL